MSGGWSRSRDGRFSGRHSGRFSVRGGSLNNAFLLILFYCGSCLDSCYGLDMIGWSSQSGCNNPRGKLERCCWSSRGDFRIRGRSLRLCNIHHCRHTMIEGSR